MLQSPQERRQGQSEVGDRCVVADVPAAGEASGGVVPCSQLHCRMQNCKHRWSRQVAQGLHVPCNREAWLCWVMLGVVHAAHLSFRRRAAIARKVLGDEGWEEGKGSWILGIVSVHAFSSFITLQAGNYTRFRCMRDFGINPWCFIQGLVQSYFRIISNVDTYSSINYSGTLFSPYICRLLNSSTTLQRNLFPNFGPLFLCSSICQ